MNATRVLPMIFALAAAALPSGGCRPRTVAGPEISVLDLQSVPDGHYLVNLQRAGQESFLNLQVKDGLAREANSSNPRLKGFEGKFELIGNGVFQVVFRNRDYTATQWWLFRPDGSAIVREAPDRGEWERAIPVPDDSLEQPKAARGLTHPQADAAQRR